MHLNPIDIAGLWSPLLLGMSSQPGTLAQTPQATNSPPPPQLTNAIAAQRTNATTGDLGKGTGSVTQFLVQAFFTILGGVIAGWIGIWSASFNRKQNAKIEFRVFISKRFGMADYSHPEELLTFYQKSRDEIRTAVLELRPLLNSRQVARLDKIWYAYSGLGEKDFEWPLEISLVSEATSTPKPSDLLRSYMEKFLDAAK